MNPNFINISGQKNAATGINNNYNSDLELTKPLNSNKIRVKSKYDFIRRLKYIFCVAGIPEWSKGRVLRSRALASWVRIPLPVLLSSHSKFFLKITKNSEGSKFLHTAYFCSNNNNPWR